MKQPDPNPELDRLMQAWRDRYFRRDEYESERVARLASAADRFCTSVALDECIARVRRPIVPQPSPRGGAPAPDYRWCKIAGCAAGVIVSALLAGLIFGALAFHGYILAEKIAMIPFGFATGYFGAHAFSLWKNKTT